MIACFKPQENLSALTMGIESPYHVVEAIEQPLLCLGTTSTLEHLVQMIKVLVLSTKQGVVVLESIHAVDVSCSSPYIETPDIIDESVARLNRIEESVNQV